MKITILNGGHRSIELPLSDEELNFQMRQMGIRETIPKGKLVKVSEKDNPLQKLEGQFLNMDEVNFFARRMEHLTEYERKVLAVYANDCDVSTIKDLINLTFSMKGLSLLTDFQMPVRWEYVFIRTIFRNTRRADGFHRVCKKRLKGEQCESTTLWSVGRSWI